MVRNRSNYMRSRCCEDMHGHAPSAGVHDGLVQLHSAMLDTDIVSGSLQWDHTPPSNPPPPPPPFSDAGPSVSRYREWQKRVPLESASHELVRSVRGQGAQRRHKGPGSGQGVRQNGDKVQLIHPKKSAVAPSCPEGSCVRNLGVMIASIHQRSGHERGLALRPSRSAAPQCTHIQERVCTRSRGSEWAHTLRIPNGSWRHSLPHARPTRGAFNVIHYPQMNACIGKTW